jgi:two-component system cell cycle response regulator DivK
MDKTVLYIEDNADNRRLIAKALQAKGYTVLLASDGMSGWELIEKHRPKLVLLDISLPGEIDGLEVAARTKVLDADYKTRIIAVTASAMVGDREYLLSHGCDDYMAKPISIQNLLNKVYDVFNSCN